MGKEAKYDEKRESETEPERSYRTGRSHPVLKDLPVLRDLAGVRRI
jgi:hypothetical protein